MSERESVLQHAEAFVREVIEKDFKQKVDSETLRAAAIKASSGIPVSPPVFHGERVTNRRTTMAYKLTRPSLRSSQSMQTVSGKGQNRPAPGGSAGAGKARGNAALKSASSGTMDDTQPGAMSLSEGQDKFVRQQQVKKR